MPRRKRSLLPVTMSDCVNGSVEISDGPAPPPTGTTPRQSSSESRYYTAPDHSNNYRSPTGATTNDSSWTHYDLDDDDDGGGGGEGAADRHAPPLRSRTGGSSRRNYGSVNHPLGPDDSTDAAPAGLRIAAAATTTTVHESSILMTTLDEDDDEDLVLMPDEAVPEQPSHEGNGGGPHNYSGSHQSSGHRRLSRGGSGGSSHHNNSGAVKNASKKVLAAAGRPWKSVKRRFTRADHSLSSDAADDGPPSPPPQPLLHLHGGSTRFFGGGRSSPVPTSPGLGAVVPNAPLSLPSTKAAADDGAAVEFPGRTSPTTVSTVRQTRRRRPGDGAVLLPPTSPLQRAWTALYRAGAAAEAAADNDATFVAAAEGVLRSAVALAVAALAGTRLSDARLLQKATEYALVAWLTCLALRWVAAYRARQTRRQQQQQRLSIIAPLDEHEPLLPHDQHVVSSAVAEEWSPPVVDLTNAVAEEWPPVPDSDRVINGDERPSHDAHNVYNDEFASPRKVGAASQLPKRSKSLDGETMAAHLRPPLTPRVELLSSAASAREPRTAPVVHPALDPYYVIDTEARARVFPNTTNSLFPLDTDYFHGRMLVLIRTPDADSDGAVKGTPENESAVAYFRGKQRRFEFQFQVKLKKVPTGRVYFACELMETIKLGMIQRAFVSAAMAFVKSSNPNFHYRLAGTPETPDGRWESPHMAFPVEEGMNRVVTTPPGEQPPALGQEIFEADASIKQRKKGVQVDWNKENTYTFSLWSAYVDFLDWRCLNLPGIRPFSLSNVIGPQPIILTLYELLTDQNDTESELSKQHYKCNTVNIVRLEMCNSAKSGVGPGTRQWLSEHRSHDPVEPTDEAGPREMRDLAAEIDCYEEDADTGDDSNDSGGELQDPEEPAEDFGNGGDNTNLSEAFAEDLGEGIYVRSGDAITLRESFADNDGSRGSSGLFCVVNGGGFAVLQEHNPGIIVIEKTGRSRAWKDRLSSRLIKSGDTVVFKLVGKSGHDDADARYLTIHRGWWLKWVSVFPKTNGFFTIHTHETEYAVRGRATETQASYLTLGGSFWLRHKRWSAYHVGIATEASATYGGRILGLHIPPKYGGDSTLGDDFNCPSDDGLDAVRLDTIALEANGKSKSEWMRPLQLQAYESGPGTLGVPLKNAREDAPDDKTDFVKKSKLSFSMDNYNMDVPCFVEIMNRVERIRQHAYVVRVLPPEFASAATPRETSGGGLSQDEKKSLDTAFVRLRTGRDLAQVMRVGLKWRNSVVAPRRGKPSLLEASLMAHGNDSPTHGQRRQRSNSSPMNFSTNSFDIADDPNTCIEHDVGSSDCDWDVDSIDDVDSVDSRDDGVDLTHDPSSKRRSGKGRNLIGKIAHSVKSKTTAAARTTTKKVVSQTVKVGLGTVNAGKGAVNAGKAILPIRPKKPPMKEPKSAKRHSRRQRASGLRVDVSSRSMRRVALMESHLNSSILAGELSAPEQSCRTVSSMVAKMSTQMESSFVSESFSDLLGSLVETLSDLDSGFLRGGALQVGISSHKTDSQCGSLLFESLIARCLWESHWREEWCGLYEKGLIFYAPLTDSPCLMLPFSDVKFVRFLDEGPISPLSGYPLLVVETAWLCHYCAFSSARARQIFFDRIEDVRSVAAENDDLSITSTREKELSEARFWQGFQTAIQYSRSFGGGKWANVSSGSKLKSRAVLNNRRMVFDLKPPENGDDANFVEQLLSTALSFSLESLNPEALIQFLDSTSLLRTLQLREIDRESPQAFCLFANIYHTLLQHALLFSVNGPLHKRSFNHFMRTSCYEIGGDVFSLAELYSCVLRGHMSRPALSRPPYIDAPKKSNSYRFYALGFTNPNVNFLLNTGDLACPRTVPVLNAFKLGKQLDSQTSDYIRKNLVVDVARKQVILPKLFDVYRNDFGTDYSHPGSGHECLRFSLPYLDEPMASQVRFLLDDPAGFTIKFQPASEQFYSSIKLRTMDVVSSFPL